MFVTKEQISTEYDTMNYILKSIIFIHDEKIVQKLIFHLSCYIE